MKQNLQLRMSQNLALTPQLQQSIRLLQLSTLELSQELETILQENPLLELGDDDSDYADEMAAKISDADANQSNADADLADASELNNELNGELTEDFNNFDNVAEISVKVDEKVDGETSLEEGFSSSDFDDDYDEYGSASNWDESSRQNDDDDDNSFDRHDVASISLREHLIDQVKLMQISQRDIVLVGLLIDSVTDDGYLDQPLDDILEVLPEELEIEPEELDTALKMLQHLDPIGVGARDLAECLVLQLQSLPADTPFVKVAIALSKNHLALLANKDFIKLRKILSCDEAELKGAQALIRAQNPRPGADFATIRHDHYIQHDVLIKKVKGIWVATLNDGVIPKLRINQLYADILKRNRESNSAYLQTQMQEARWMIKNIQQRFSTILRVSQAIVDRQRNFFEHGEIAMRPLVLREIAEELELHESTISRVTTHKYMLTPRGVFELKYFFGSHVATDAGGEASATAIRALIKQLVAEENAKKPLSDNQITDILGKQGIIVARRTIAKYRESLNIPPANLRKVL